MTSLVVPFLANAGAQAVQQGMNMLGQGVQNAFGASQGRTNVGDAQKVVDYIKSNNLQIDPEHQARLAEAASRDNQQFQQGMSRADTLFGAALGNQAANLNNQRAAALNAQSNAATLAGQQLQNAANRAQANAQAIQGAIGAGMNLAR